VARLKQETLRLESAANAVRVAAEASQVKFMSTEQKLREEVSAESRLRLELESKVSRSAARLFQLREEMAAAERQLKQDADDAAQAAETERQKRDAAVAQLGALRERVLDDPPDHWINTATAGGGGAVASSATEPMLTPAPPATVVAALQLQLRNRVFCSRLHNHKRDSCSRARDQFKSPQLTTALVTRVQQVQNRMLWSRYCLKKGELEKRAGGAAITTDLNSRPSVQAAFGSDVCRDPRVNEFNLFHGTKPDIAAILASGGFDPSVSKLNSGLYGAGVYFAQDSCKSLQYCQDTNADGEHCMLYCRVLMGEPYATNRAHRKERRPPDNPATPRQPYDSIFAEQGVASSGRQAHNEFVVFDRAQVYPDYIIWFKLS
jgi:hypothetical protein